MHLFFRGLFFSLLCVLYCAAAEGQIWKKVIPGKDAGEAVKLENESIDRQLRADVNYLASDNLEGRLAGTNGEMLAGTYIQKRMTEIGLLPYGRSYTRSFKFEHGTELAPEVRFSINGRFISVPEDAFPASYSVGGKDENYVLPKSTESGSPWLIPLYESENQAKDPNYNWEAESYKSAKAAIERGATSVLFYDNYGSRFFPSYKKTMFNGERLNIPVLMISKKVYDQYIANMRVMQPLFVNIAYKKLYKSATNVMGYINNNATQTVVIGAHYDHLGNGADFFDNKTNTKTIYNGANDNASGVAAMLALANKLVQSRGKKYNYLFIAFSAEEYGAVGSKAFVSASDFVKGNFSYMLNLDRVGRLAMTNRFLWINGVGSSLSWNALGSVNSNFKFIKDSAAIAPSDESSFYNIGIPVLSFSSGLGPDYHQPNDDAASINIVGIRDIVQYVFGITQEMETEQVPLFATYQATKIVQEEKGKVNLGILPDYNFKTGGVRIDGLVSDQPASKAGLLQGDIIQQMANFKITDIDAYKKAMASFKAGDQVKIKVKRARSLLDFTVLF